VAPRRVAVTTSCNDDDKGVDGSDEEYVAAAKRNFKRQVWQPGEHFKKLLKVACPKHAYPIRHKLKGCTMFKNFMTSRALSLQGQEA
jgi:hypothetical protein